MEDGKQKRREAHKNDKQESAEQTVNITFYKSSDQSPKKAVKEMIKKILVLWKQCQLNMVVNIYMRNAKFIQFSGNKR